MQYSVRTPSIATPLNHDKIEMDVREIGWDGIDWIHLARDRDKWRK
jgi:hypothetical protein